MCVGDGSGSINSLFLRRKANIKRTASRVLLLLTLFLGSALVPPAFLQISYGHGTVVHFDKKEGPGKD